MPRLATVVKSERFDLFICGVIAANAVTLGLGTFPSLADSPVLYALNTAFYAIFVVELVMRIAAYGNKPWRFFTGGWNVFDFLTVTAALIPGVSASAQALRLVRLARIVRVVRFLPDARVLLNSVWRSLPPLGSIVVLTGLLLFVYGMLGWSLFGTALPESWGSVSVAMLTLFVLLTTENFPTYLAEAMAVSPWAVPFFVSYILLAAFIVFNLLIGIIIGSLEQARDAERRGVMEAPEVEVVARIDALRDALDHLESDLAKTSARPTE